MLDVRFGASFSRQLAVAALVGAATEVPSVVNGVIDWWQARKEHMRSAIAFIAKLL
jgi:hypothetical protein